MGLPVTLVESGGLPVTLVDAEGQSIVWPAKNHFVLDAWGAALSVPGGTTSKVALRTVVVPGGLMGLNGALRGQFIYTMTNGADDKIPTIDFGGVSFAAPVFTTTAHVRFEYMIQNRNSLSAQVGQLLAGIGATSGVAPVTATIDTSVDQNYVVGGQLEVAGQTLTLERFTLELLQAP